MSTAIKAFAAAVIAVGAWACQSVAQRPDVAIRNEFSHVRINKIGDLRPTALEYVDIALLNGFDTVLTAGVPSEALKEATVAPVYSTGVAPLVGPFGYPTYYELWVKVADCPLPVYMKTSQTGRVFSVLDEGKCLPATSAAGLRPY